MSMDDHEEIAAALAVYQAREQAQTRHLTVLVWFLVVVVTISGMIAGVSLRQDIRNEKGPERTARILCQHVIDQGMPIPEECAEVLPDD